MATLRKVIFTNNSIYHIFNRGIEKRKTFSTIKEYNRMIRLIEYYQYKNPPLRFSQFIHLPFERQMEIRENLYLQPKLVNVLCFCLMPNHFHLVLQQLSKNGISQFIANLSNAYTKYFNTLYDRPGPLFQGTFKAVFIEDDDQLIHLSRYIHLNPVSARIISVENLPNYIWSSYPAYIDQSQYMFINTNQVLSRFKSKKAYQKFVYDQANYAKTLAEIKQLSLE